MPVVVSPRVPAVVIGEPETPKIDEAGTDKPTLVTDPPPPELHAAPLSTKFLFASIETQSPLTSEPVVVATAFAVPDGVHPAVTFAVPVVVLPRIVRAPISAKIERGIVFAPATVPSNVGFSISGPSCSTSGPDPVGPSSRADRTPDPNALVEESAEGEEKNGMPPCVPVTVSPRSPDVVIGEPVTPKIDAAGTERPTDVTVPPLPPPLQGIGVPPFNETKRPPKTSPTAPAEMSAPPPAFASVQK